MISGMNLSLLEAGDEDCGVLRRLIERALCDLERQQGRVDRVPAKRLVNRVEEALADRDRAETGGRRALLDAPRTGGDQRSVARADNDVPTTAEAVPAAAAAALASEKRSKRVPSVRFATQIAARAANTGAFASR